MSALIGTPFPCIEQRFQTGQRVWYRTASNGWATGTIVRRTALNYCEYQVALEGYHEGTRTLAATQLVPYDQSRDGQVIKYDTGCGWREGAILRATSPSQNRYLVMIDGNRHHLTPVFAENISF